jgi:hypothetical protein
MPDSPIAFVCVYNEADILPWTVAHLVRQGCRVHIIDNWSTDGSYELTFSWCSTYLPYAQARAVTLERWPSAGPLPYYDWIGLLEHVTKLAAASDAPWCIHQDADEVRRTPWPDVTLAEGFKRVKAEGYDCINHQLYLFPPIDNGYQGDPERYFRFYTLDCIDAHAAQIKAWANTRRRVNLAHGGHRVQFPGQLVYPHKWTIKHYPVRSQAHGERKVLHERMPRYRPEERARGWHVQYDNVEPGYNFLWDPAVLKEWGAPTSGVPQH